MPRALDAARGPRLDLFVFLLLKPSDLARFEVGERIDLVTVGA